MKWNRQAAVRWAGTLLQVAGAVILATRLAQPPVAYTVMLVGSVIWALIATKRADWALAAMMGAYTVINVVGLIAWWQP